MQIDLRVEQECNGEHVGVIETIVRCMNVIQEKFWDVNPDMCDLLGDKMQIYYDFCDVSEILSNFYIYGAFS